MTARVHLWLMRHGFESHSHKIPQGWFKLITFCLVFTNMIWRLSSLANRDAWFSYFLGSSILLFFKVPQSKDSERIISVFKSRCHLCSLFLIYFLLSKAILFFKLGQVQDQCRNLYFIKQWRKIFILYSLFYKKYFTTFYFIKKWRKCTVNFKKHFLNSFTQL